MLSAPIPSLRDRLLEAEDMSLSIISQDISAMQNFYELWSTLGTEVAEAVDQESIDSETISMAHRVADRISILASRFITFYEDVDALTSSFEQELGDMISQLDIVDARATVIPLPDSESFSYIIVFKIIFFRKRKCCFSFICQGCTDLATGKPPQSISLQRNQIAAIESD